MTDSNSSRTLAVSPADGPVAVTGASGYVGSWIVRELVEQGYTVRSCVRDPGIPEKVDHLLAMNDSGLPGSNTLFAADLFRRGSYDAAFDGCCAVMHAGAILTRSGAAPQQVYDGCFTVVEHVIESVRRAGTVRRLILTSSVLGGLPPGPRRLRLYREGLVHRQHRSPSERLVGSEHPQQPARRLRHRQDARRTLDLQGGRRRRALRVDVDSAARRHRARDVRQPR